MKRSMCLLLAGLLLASLVAPASAAAPKKVTLFLHGNYPIGDFAEMASNVSEGTTMVMDTTKPSDPAPKSFGIFQPFNEQCTGNPLMPSWEGRLSGTIVGPIKLTAHFIAPPTKVRVRLWNDIAFSSCTSSAAGTDAYQDPKWDEVVDVPAGHNAVDIVLKNKKLPVKGNLILEISQANGASSQGRVLYDSADTASALQFSCSGC